MGNFVRNLEPERLALELAGIVLNRRKKRLNRRLKGAEPADPDAGEKRQVVWMNDASFFGNGRSFLWTTCRLCRLLH